jgi:hypothetical protein
MSFFATLVGLFLGSVSVVLAELKEATLNVV